MNAKVGISLATDGLVLAQASSAIRTAALAQMGEETHGLVLTDKAGIAKASDLRAAGFDRPIVLDLLNVARSDSEQGRLARQQAWNLALAHSFDVIVSPSRRVRVGDEAALDGQLSEADGLLSLLPSDGSPQGMAGLSLGADWLRGPSLEALSRRLSEAQRPVAVAFAHPFDPIRSQDHVRGLLSLVQCADVAILRSDLAGIGAWAHGARFASVGLSSTVRHLPVPMPNQASGDRDLTPHVLVPGCWAWTKASTLYFIGDHPKLMCTCQECQGQSLARLGDGRDVRHEEALIHSFRVWAGLVDHLLGAPADELHIAWQRECKTAVDTEAELADDLGVELRWRPLSHWVWL
jgi:hypothetical protein